MASEENYLRAARIVAEDEGTLLLEVHKADDARPDVDRGERWVMVVFVREDGGRLPEPWLPWRGDS